MSISIMLHLDVGGTTEQYEDGKTIRGAVAYPLRGEIMRQVGYVAMEQVRNNVYAQTSDLIKRMTEC